MCTCAPVFSTFYYPLIIGCLRHSLSLIVSMLCRYIDYRLQLNEMFFLGMSVSKDVQKTLTVFGVIVNAIQVRQEKRKLRNNTRNWGSVCSNRSHKFTLPNWSVFMHDIARKRNWIGHFTHSWYRKESYSDKNLWTFIEWNWFFRKIEFKRH